MIRTSQHRISHCTSCHHMGAVCQAGYEMIQKLRESISAAGEAIPEDFEISGTACLTSCPRACIIGYYGSKDATYLFGDVSSEAELQELVAYAKAYSVDVSGIHGVYEAESLAQIAAQSSSFIAIERSTQPMH